MRAKDSKTPVLLLTARDALEDRIAGLDTGADDYLVKPFGLAELAARLRALLRRATADSWAEEPIHWQVADLGIDVTVRRVNRAGRSIDLTPREFDLLVQLFRNDRVERITTAPGARTGFLSQNSGRLYVAVPHRGSQAAKVLVYTIEGG